MTLQSAATEFLASFDAFQAACEAAPTSPDVDDSDMMRAADRLRVATIRAGDESQLTLAAAQYLAIVDSFETDGPCPVDMFVADIRDALAAFA